MPKPRRYDNRDQSEAEAVKALRGLGFDVMQIGGDPPGVPDLVVCKHGLVLFVEWKTPGGRLSANQEKRHAELQAAGATVITVWDDVQPVIDWFNERVDS